MSSPLFSKKNPWLERFLGSGTVLVFDSHSARRAGVVQALLTQGVKPAQLHVADRFDSAWKMVSQLRPLVLVTEVGGDGRNASDLVARQRAYCSDRTKESAAIVISSGFSDTAQAHSMQAGFDLILEWPISNPLWQEDFGTLLTQVILGKNKKMTGKDLALAKSLVNEAIAKFDFSRKVAYGLSRDPATQSKVIESFDDLLSKEQWLDAYLLGKCGLAHFVQFQERLPELLRLAIATQHFEDIGQFYQTYKRMDRRSEDLTQTMLASLVVGAQTFLSKGRKDRALEYFRYAAVSSANQPKLLREIVLDWVRAGAISEAREFLGRFGPRERKLDSYLALEYLIFDRERAAGESLTRGFALYARPVRDPLVYSVLIRRLAEVGKMDSAEHIYHQALKLWPDESAHFEAPKAPDSSTSV